MQYLAVLRIVQNNGSAFGLGQNCNRTIPGLVGDRLDWWRQTLPVDQVFGNNMVEMVLTALMEDMVKAAVVCCVCKYSDWRRELMHSDWFARPIKFMILISRPIKYKQGMNSASSSVPLRQ